MDFSITDYNIKNIDRLDSPALVIFPETVRQNIAHAVRMVGDVNRLRPHIKTNKSAEATRLLMEAGITKFKCATIAEAEMLGICGAKDVLLAYQPIGPKLQRFITLIQKYPETTYACLVDNLEAAWTMAVNAAEAGLQIPVFLDLNTGQNRTGITTTIAPDLYLACLNMKGIRPVGLHAYDGHIRQTDFAQRKAACDEAFQQVAVLRDEFVRAGLDTPVVIAGGSPSFPIHAERKDVECSPGTFIYWDKGYSDLCPEQPFSPAAWLITRVISLPDATKICLDLGHKSVASENEITKRIWFPEAPGLVPTGQSEEHLVLEAGAGHSFKAGDVLYGVPYHVCPTVALYESAPVVEDGVVTGEWLMMARNRKITC